MMGCKPQLSSKLLACSISFVLWFKTPDGATMATVSPAFKYGGCINVLVVFGHIFCANAFILPKKKVAQNNRVINEIFDIM
jgi:hypothetical protein